MNGIVDDLKLSSLSQNSSVDGVKLSDGQIIDSKSVILTTGTFLRGVCHYGNKRIEAGRMPDTSSEKKISE